MKKVLVAGLIFLINFMGLVFAQELYQEEGWKFTIPFGKKYDYNNILVKRVLDAKTFILEDGQETVLIGVDDFNKGSGFFAPKPDMDKLRQDSLEYLKDLMEGRLVRLEFDQRRYDNDNHMFAYVYLADGTFVNAQMIKDGYALAKKETVNVKFQDLFSKLQAEAKRDGRGLW